MIESEPWSQSQMPLSLRAITGEHTHHFPEMFTAEQLKTIRPWIDERLRLTNKLIDLKLDALRKRLERLTK